jgi:hypothetical protein
MGSFSRWGRSVGEVTRLPHFHQHRKLAAMAILVAHHRRKPTALIARPHFSFQPFAHCHISTDNPSAKVATLPQAVQITSKDYYLEVI